MPVLVEHSAETVPSEYCEAFDPVRSKGLTWSRARLEIYGPLTPYAAGFTEWLGHNGYAPTTMRTHQRRMNHLSRWMQTAGIDSAEFGPATVAAFIAAQTAAGRFSDWKAGSWAALLQH